MHWQMRRVSRGVLRTLLESATSTLESLIVTSSQLVANPDHVKGGRVSISTQEMQVSVLLTSHAMIQQSVFLKCPCSVP